MVTKQDLAEGRVYPPLADIRAVSTKIAVHLSEFAYKEDLAHHFPQPSDMKEFITAQQYDIDYESYVPALYDWPGHSTKMN